jgi:hypothetical protein
MSAGSPSALEHRPDVGLGLGRTVSPCFCDVLGDLVDDFAPTSPRQIGEFGVELLQVALDRAIDPCCSSCPAPDEVIDGVPEAPPLAQKRL